jgi:hypothetical protein
MHVDFLRVVLYGESDDIGPLGHGDLTNVKVPKAVKALGDHKVTFIACGGAWTTAAIGKLSLPYIRFLKTKTKTLIIFVLM